MGSGKDFRYIAARDIACAMGADKERCLPLFCGMTGCDTVPSFNGTGTKKAWDVWHTFTELHIDLSEIISTTV